MSHSRILLDARVTGVDGIGRYTRNLVQAITALLPHLGIEGIEILSRSNELQQHVRNGKFQQHMLSYRIDTSEHYTCAELQYLANTADQTAGSLLHCTDYRTPLSRLKIPLVVSIHDIFRYTDPSLCYSDMEFKVRYGNARFREICKIVSELEMMFALTEKSNQRENDLIDSYHQRYYQLLLKWAIQ